MFTREQYQEAIESLKRGMTQIEPTSDNCAICGDGHPVWQCHHNPLVHSKRFWDSKIEWRCFHCNYVFTDEIEAKEHFGDCDSEYPACIESANKLDDLKRMVNSQAEDAGLWFIAKTAPEAYLQQELRKLHAMCEDI